MNVLTRWVKGTWLGRNEAFVRTPTPIVPNHPGYAIKRREQALAATCRQLRVKQIGPPRYGFSEKSIGAPVIDSDRNLAWVKVAGRPIALTDPFFEGELAAGGLRGLPKPEILTRNERISNGIRWRGIKMTLAPSEPAAAAPWLQGGVHVTDNWLLDLRTALGSLGEAKTDRVRASSEWLRLVITSRFGDRAPHVADQWLTAHGDLHWANLTSPHLMILDWDCFGMAPRGYDCATLLAYSALDPELTIRLHEAFRVDLDTRSGLVSRLAMYAVLLDLIDHGWLLRDLREPLERMAQHALAGY